MTKSYETHAHDWLKGKGGMGRGGSHGRHKQMGNYVTWVINEKIMLMTEMTNKLTGTQKT